MTKSEIAEIVSALYSSVELFTDDVDSGEDAPSISLYQGQVEGYLNCLCIANVISSDEVSFIIDKMEYYKGYVLFGEEDDDTDTVSDLNDIVRQYLEGRIDD